MITHLPRTVLQVSGEGVADWLDGLLTNRVTGEAPMFAALLTPQGKIIADMILTPAQDGLLVDTTEAMGAELQKRLTMYKLRAPITITDRSADLHVHALWGEATEDDLPPGAMPDPRHASLGYRLISPSIMAETDLAAYDAHRLSLGIPDSQFDFGPVELFPADAAMDELNGINFKKGCFIGQEVASRMHRMSTVKKRLRAVVLKGPASKGDTIQSGSRRIGDIVHVRDNMGMALIRLDRLTAATEALSVNGVPVTIMDGPNG